MPKPGEIRSKDFRAATSAPIGDGKTEPIRLVQWNIERGYCLLLHPRLTAATLCTLNPWFANRPCGALKVYRGLVDGLRAKHIGLP